CMVRKIFVAPVVGLVMLLAGSMPVLHGQTTTKRPIANAGPNQVIESIGILVRLDGSASINPTGAPLLYHWSFESVPTGSTATLNGADSVAPTFVPDRPGPYRVQLVVDNGLRSAADVVAVIVNNRPPVANAGPDQTSAVGNTVVLDGSASTDPDGDLLTYRWRIDSRPSGSHARLTNPTSVRATFVVDQPGTYMVRLIVDDGQTRATDSVVIAVPNSVPVANAGPDQKASLGARVRLDGSASTDADGDRLRYAWTFISVPSGSAAQLA